MKSPFALISRPVLAASIATLALTGGSLLSAATPAFADGGDTSARHGSTETTLRKICPDGTHAHWSLSYTPPSTITLSVECVANGSAT